MSDVNLWDIQQYIESDFLSAKYYGLSADEWDNLYRRAMLGYSPRLTPDEMDMYQCITELSRQLMHGKVTNV